MKVRSRGVSYRAYQLECQYRLDEVQLRGETLEHFLEILCKEYGVEVPKLVFDGRLGRGTRTVRYGYYRAHFDGGGEIKLSRNVGMSVETLIHELSHHVVRVSHGMFHSHDSYFQDQHEAMLEDFVEGNVEADGIVYDPERMKTEAKLDDLYTTYPDLYDKVWREGISADEVIVAVESQVAELKSKFDWLTHS